jgi:hypothetical protein
MAITQKAGTKLGMQRPKKCVRHMQRPWTLSASIEPSTVAKDQHNLEPAARRVALRKFIKSFWRWGHLCLQPYLFP